MVKSITTVSLMLLLTSCGLTVVTESEKAKFEKKCNDAIKLSAEYGYFEGQKDALEGDIRITKVDTNYVWLKSPWDDPKIKVQYNPLNGLK